MPAPWPETMEESEAKRPRVLEENGRSRECRRSIQSAGGVCWSSSDLALAAKLLETPNARFPTITFTNVEEKRRVFTLVYDVLRYKSVLNQALNDVHFFNRYSYLKERCHLVWLLFLDLYKRDFTLRDPLDPEVEAAFHAQTLFEIDEVLWQLRVKLAATVSRLRIKSGAHSLSNLLPRHLQVTRSVLEENIISGWVNIFKTSLKDTCDYLENYGFKPLYRDREALEPLTYRTDHLLPRFLHIMPNVRDDLVECPLVRDHHIVMQERTFCLGPTVMAQLLKDYALSGKVAQTHVNSPITMAYFANLLINNDKIESLLVFGAGYRKEACEQYLRELGVKNTLVFSESFAGLSPESRVLDNVIAVLATPPNTNSSVVDPVDLAVARGGDLQILQQLTDDDFASTPRGDNINKFLKDQRDTLRRGMSKPQIQFIVYETHSRFHCENEEMTLNLVNELNNYAREVHLEELRRAQGETQEKERSQMETSDSSAEVPAIRVEEELALPLPTPVQSVQSVQIPPSDLFEIGDLPDLCPNLDNCLNLASEGTYIAVVKRKEITRLDPKYMIQMAEARGLFGRPDATPKAKTPGQTARAKAALAALQARSDSFEKSKTKVKVEMDRIAAPTRASLLRDVHAPATKDCPRYAHHLAHDGTPSYMYPDSVPRKSFLSVTEEEDLIRRLYICPRFNLFSPKLYEDLPPLKFWNSPANVIECYLQRKVFQNRLQMAYEFNQSKETSDSPLQDDNPEHEQLSKALNQLSEDIHYFTNLTQQPVPDEPTRTLSCGNDQNNDRWDEILPKVDCTHLEDNSLCNEDEEMTASKSKIKLHYNIGKRISNYNNYYRLKNLTSKDKKPPLALTIDKPPKKGFIKEIKKTVSINLTQEDKFDQSEVISVESLEEFEITKYYNNKLPQIESVSDSVQNTVNLPLLKNVPRVHDDKDSLLPQIPLERRSTNFNRRGTILTLRDSIELARKKMSTRFSRFSLANDLNDHMPPPIVIPKDSYVMLTDKLPKHQTEPVSESNQQTGIDFASIRSHSRNTITEHRDSLLLALEKIPSKHHSNEELVCAICNGEESKPIQFLCESHAQDMESHRRMSPLGRTVSQLSHRDSFTIAKRKLSIKPCKISKSCQVNEINIREQTAPLKDAVEKYSKKSKLEEQPVYTQALKVPPSKLKNYLMSAVQINQIIDSTQKGISLNL